MNSRWGFKLWNMEELQFSPFSIKNVLSILDWKKKIENVKQVQKRLKPPLFLMAVAWGWSAYSFYFVNVEQNTLHLRHWYPDPGNCLTLACTWIKDFLTKCRQIVKPGPHLTPKTPLSAGYVFKSCTDMTITQNAHCWKEKQRNMCMYSLCGVVCLDDSQISTQLSVPADRNNTVRQLSTHSKVDEFTYTNLRWCCSSSVLSRITEICSARTSFLPLSLRTPDTFCPFITDTSRTSFQGRTHRLEHTNIKL